MVVPVPPAALPPHPVFRRVWTTHAVTGRTVVTWELARRFFDPKPHAFQLQAAPTSQPAAADWVDVGPPADAAYLVDDQTREYGKTFDHHYRVVLTTPAGTYASAPVRVDAPTTVRDRRLTREMLRQDVKRAGKFTGVPGYLVKRRRYGPKCPTCVDPHTDEPTRSDCPTCFGTGLDGGYHPAGDVLLYATFGLEETREDVDEALTRGTTKPDVVRAELAGFPLVNSLDLFVERDAGRRWYVQKVLGTAALRGYTFKFDAELRLVPFSDKAYDFPLEEGLA